jgi:tetratricopeptide (TPR) repeat protein
MLLGSKQRASKSKDHNTSLKHSSAYLAHASQVRGEDLRQVVLAANADGIDLLRRGQPVMAFEQLKYAEAVLVSNPEISTDDSELLALTCSNLGCYYRKAGLPRAALQYLGRALRAEKVAESSVAQDVCALATTKLNACAALSGVGRHEEAERLAVTAMQLLAPQDGNAPSREECGLLAVACHNLGAEREHLGRWAPAAIAYRQGSEVSAKVLGPQNPLTRTLQDRCTQALSKAERNPFTPRRPVGTKRSPRGRQIRRPGTAPQAIQCPPLPVQGFSWEGLSELMPSPGSAAQDGQTEEAACDVPAVKTIVSPLDQEHVGGAGAGPELEEKYLEEEDEGGEVRRRILPNLATTGPECRTRAISFNESQWESPTRRWSSSKQGCMQGISTTGPASPQSAGTRYGQNGFGAMPENQTMDEWSQQRLQPGFSVAARAFSC